MLSDSADGYETKIALYNSQMQEFCGYQEDWADGDEMKIPGDSTEQEAFKAGYVSAGIASLIDTLEVAKVRVEEASDDE